MITVNEFSENLVKLIKNKGIEPWTLTAELGELKESKDLLCYFAVTNQNVIIYNNSTLQLDCELVGTLLFENRTTEEARVLCSELYDAALQVFKSIERYEELECGVVWLDCNPMMPQTETDDMYYSFRLPITIFAQF